MGTLTLQTQESMVSSKILLLIVTVCQGVFGSSNSRGVGSVRSLKSEDAAAAGSHQSSFYTYEDYGGAESVIHLHVHTDPNKRLQITSSTGVDGADFVDYEYGINEEGEEDRQDLGLVGIFGLGGIGLATLGTVFASAMFGALMAPVVSGAFSSLSEQISDSEFELPELPFRALRHAVIDDRQGKARQGKARSSILSWIEHAESMYTALGGKPQ